MPPNLIRSLPYILLPSATFHQWSINSYSMLISSASSRSLQRGVHVCTLVHDVAPRLQTTAVCEIQVLEINKSHFGPFVLPQHFVAYFPENHAPCWRYVLAASCGKDREKTETAAMEMGSLRTKQKQGTPAPREPPPHDLRAPAAGLHSCVPLPQPTQLTCCLHYFSSRRLRLYRCNASSCAETWEHCCCC